MDTPSRPAYPTDLTDEQWHELEPLLPPAKPGGRPRAVSLREIVNAILYLLRTGCQWRMLPHDLPPKGTVSNYFYQWRDDGTLDRLLDALRGQVREQQAPSGQADPSAAILDSQSVKTTEIGGPQRGYDAAKKIKGRKRHIVVDTLGLVLAVAITAASVPDAQAAPLVLQELTAATQPRLQTIWADSAYHNYGLYDWIESQPDLNWELVIRPSPYRAREFVVVPKRWIVERSFSWINRCRRNSKDVERTPASSRAMIQWSQIHLLLRRLHPSPPDPPFRYRVAAKT